MSYLYTQDSERHKILKKFIYGDKSSSIFFFLSFLAIIPSVYLVIQYGNYLYAILNYVLFYCALVLFGKKGGVFEKFSNGYSNDNITLQKNRYIFGLNDSFHLFEGVSLRGRFVENILVCPSGIFIISENKSEGLITIRDNKIYLNSDTVISGLFQDVWMQYFALRDFFGKKGISGVSITPLIYFDRAHVQIFEKIRGTLIVDRKSVVDAILNNAEAIGSDLAQSMIALLSSHESMLPPVHLVPSTNVNFQKIGTQAEVCLQCGYERLPADDTFYDQGICPQCGAMVKSAQDAHDVAGSQSVFQALAEIATRLTRFLLSSSVMAPGIGIVIIWVIVFGVSIYKTRNLVTDYASTHADSFVEIENSTVRVSAQDTSGQIEKMHFNANSTNDRPDSALSVSENANNANVTAMPIEVDGVFMNNENKPVLNATATSEGVRAVSGALVSKNQGAATGISSAGNSTSSVLASRAEREMAHGQSNQPPSAKINVNSDAGISTRSESFASGGVIPLAQGNFTYSQPSAATGVLTVHADEDAYFWFVADYTRVKTRMYHVRAGEKIDVQLSKGGYTLYFTKKGFQKSITISFLSDIGSVDLY